MRESPTKLKKAANTLLKKLIKYNVTLNNEGEIDFDKIKNMHVRNEIIANEPLFKLTLMQADLEFEYPQKLERMMIKADLLKLVEEEEIKMKNIA